MEVINTTNAPAAIGPYSQAIKSNGMLYTSGQIPIDPVSGEISGRTISEQAEQVMKNLLAVLEAAGTCEKRIVKTTCFLADISMFAEFNSVYSNYITSCPARSCVAVRALPKNVLVEVEAIAEL